MSDPKQIGRKLEVTPEVSDAIEHERLVRDAAFLSVTEDIAGYEVLPMTIEHLVILTIAKSPLLFGGLPSPAQLAQFLWILNPAYHPQGGRARRRFLRRCREFIPASPPLFNFGRFRSTWTARNQKRLARAVQIIESSHKYVFETFQVRPPQKARKDSPEPDYFSDAAWFCANLAREYHWSEQSILKMPMKRVFQYLKEMRRHHDPKAVMFNPSDALRADALNKRVQALPAEAKP